MKQVSMPKRPARTRAHIALRDALIRQRPDVLTDDNGYAADFRGNLLPLVLPEDFEADLSSGDGNELQTKFRAAHSSSALAVNCFAPFRRRICDLVMPDCAAYDRLQFERKCPTGLRGGRSPNLDVLVSGPTGVIGVESKLTEYLSKHRAAFSPAYAEQIRDDRRDHGYFREMIRLMDAPDRYNWLDAAQLIKHAFGLAHTFCDRSITLLYLFWEPLNPDEYPEFSAHRADIAAFAEQVAGAGPRFVAMSYPELWESWAQAGPDWLTTHITNLQARYSVAIEG